MADTMAGLGQAGLLDADESSSLPHRALGSWRIETPPKDGKLPSGLITYDLGEVSLWTRCSHQ